MKINQMFPSKYATGSDLRGAVTVTIARIAAEKMRPNPQSPEVEKWVLYTQEGKRGVVLGKVLANQIAVVLGDDTDLWLGKKITLYPEAVTVAGVARVAIRAHKAAEPQPETAGANGNGAK